MNSQTDSLLETLSAELSNEEFDSASSTVAELNAEYEAKIDEEIELVDQSGAIYTDINSGASIAEAAELNALSGVHGGTQFIRVILLTTATTLIESHEELAAEGRRAEVIDIAQAAIEELSDAEDRLEEQTASVQNVIDGYDIPPSVRISIDSVGQRSFPVEGETSIQSTVNNAGEAAANAVEVQIDSTDGLATEMESRTIGSLGSSQETEFKIQVIATETGSQSIKLYVDSENAGTDLASVVFTILESPTDDFTLSPICDFDNPPMDPDDDRLYEDINGDGTFDIVDVQALSANLNDDTIQNNPDAFDFNGDGQVDSADVQALFDKLQGER